MEPLSVFPPASGGGMPISPRATTGQSDKISALISKLLNPRLTNEQIVATINESLDGKVFSELAVSDLGIFERAIQSVYDSRCRGVVSYIRSLFFNGIERACSHAVDVINAKKTHRAF